MLQWLWPLQFASRPAGRATAHGCLAAETPARMHCSGKGKGKGKASARALADKQGRPLARSE